METGYLEMFRGQNVWKILENQCPNSFHRQVISFQIIKRSNDTISSVLKS